MNWFASGRSKWNIHLPHDIHTEVKKYVISIMEIMVWLIDCIWVRDLTAPEARRPYYTGPLCPISRSWDACSPTKAPDGPQAYNLNILRFQKKKGTQMHMSEWGQGLTFTKIVGRGFLFYSTPPYTADCLAALGGRDVFSGCCAQSEGQSQPWTVSY